MRRFGSGALVGLVLGVLAGANLAAFLPDRVAHERYMGKLNGLSEVMQALREEFGEAGSAQARRYLFSFKTSAAAVVEVDGVKTIRVVP